MATSYTYVLGVDFTAVNIDLPSFQSIISGSSISSATVQYLIRSGTSVVIWFNNALSGPDQTTLAGLVSSYVYVAPTQIVFVDTTSVQTVTNKKLDTTNTIIDVTTSSKVLGFSLSGMTASTQLTLAGTLSASRTYTFPDAGAASNILLSNSTGTQTISTGNITLAGTSATLALSGASSTVTLANTTASTSSSTGALQVAGGAYFGANSLFNANLTMQGASAVLAMSGASATATFANTTQSTSSSTGTIQNAGGLFTKNIWLGGTSFATQAVSTAGPLFNVASTTVTANNTSDMAFVSIQQPTLANSVVSSTTANASTLYIANAPAAGTNETITNAYALNVAAGKVRIGGTLQIPTGAVNGYVLTSDASGNASWTSTTSFGFNGFTDGTVAAPGAYWASDTSTGFYRIGASNIALSLGGTQYINYTTTSTTISNTLIPTKAGSTTAATCTFYSNPASTALTGSSNYFFNYFNTPTTTGSTTGTASTVFIANAPANATTSYALNVAAGASLFGGNVTLSGTSAVLSLTDAASSISVSGTTTSTSSTTGSVKLSGGLAINTATAASSATNGGSFTTAGGIGVALASFFGDNVTLSGTSATLALSGASSTVTLANTTASTSSSTGALQVAGGVYFGANSLFNANLTMQGASAILAMSGASATATFANTTQSTSSSTGTIQNAGGLFTKNIWLGGTSFATQAVSTAGPLFNVASTTVTANNTADMAFVSIQQPTLANSVVSSTTANASTLYIANAPAAGTNETITNAYALNVAAGKVRIGGTLQIPTGATNGYVLTSDASGNASWSSTTTSTTLTYSSAISTTIFATTSTSRTNITTMTLTPNTAGTYLVYFIANFVNNANNKTATFDLALNGTSITNTTNAMTITNASANNQTAVSCVQVFNGSTDTVTARVSITAGSQVTVNYRFISCMRVSA